MRSSTEIIYVGINESNDVYLNLTKLSSTNTSQSYNWPVLSISMFSIFGIFGNLLVCMTIKRDHTLQTKTNYYLFSLAIADLAVCVIVIPLSVVQDFTGISSYELNYIQTKIYKIYCVNKINGYSARIYVPFGYFQVCCLRSSFSTCHSRDLINFFPKDILLCTSSIYHLSAVSILRFIAIQFPLKSHQTTSRQLTYFVLLLIWTISIFISSAIIYLGHINQENVMDMKTLRCILRNEKFMIYGSTISFVIPLLIMIIMFVLMVRKLRMQLSKIDKTSVNSLLSTPINNKFEHELCFFKKSIKEQNKSFKRSDKKSPKFLFSSKSNYFDQRGRSINVNSITNQKALNGTLNFEEFDNSLPGNPISPNQSNSLRRHAICSFPDKNLSISSTSISSLKIKRNRYKKSDHIETGSFHSTVYTSSLNRSISRKTFTNSLYKTSNYEFKNGVLIHHASHSEVQNEMKALKVLGIVFCAFIIAWLPFCLLNMLSATFEIYKESAQKYMIYLTYLGYFQSTFNPIIYTVFNQKFRRNFLEIIKCISKKNRRFERYN